MKNHSWNLLVLGVLGAAPVIPAAHAELPPTHSISNDSAAALLVKPHAFSIEILGRGGLYSINYDRLVSEQLAVGGGLSYHSLSGSLSGSIFLIPVYMNFYFTPGRKHAFLTGGADISIASGTSGTNVFSGSGVLGIVGAGYEYRSEGGFLFRLAPYVAFSGTGSTVTLGLSVGTVF